MNSLTKWRAFLLFLLYAAGSTLETTHLAYTLLFINNWTNCIIWVLCLWNVYKIMNFFRMESKETWQNSNFSLINFRKCFFVRLLREKKKYITLIYKIHILTQWNGILWKFFLLFFFCSFSSFSRALIIIIVSVSKFYIRN